MVKATTNDVRNESIRAALMALYAAHDGALAPKHIVDAARDVSSPLHDEFEWDDDAAAEMYRLAQAGALVRRMKLTIIRKDAEARNIHITTTRQFQSRASQRKEDAGYETLEDILDDPEKRAELLAQVLRELNAYRKRYAELSELSEIWDAIKSLQPETPSHRGGEESPRAPAG